MCAVSYRRACRHALACWLHCPLLAAHRIAGISDLPGSKTWYPSWNSFAQASTPTHELGHNLGLGHSNTSIPYGDYSSCMGNNDGVSGTSIPGLCYAFPQQVFLGCE